MTADDFVEISIRVPREMAEQYGLEDSAITMAEPSLVPFVASMLYVSTHPTTPEQRLVDLRRRERYKQEREKKREQYRFDTRWADEEALDRLWPPARLAFVWHHDDEPTEEWERRPIEKLKEWHEASERTREQ